MVTIKQIAAELDVSPTTVSNVIHGNTKEVSPQTIQRVREKIVVIFHNCYMVIRNIKVWPYRVSCGKQPDLIRFLSEQADMLIMQSFLS